MGSQEFLPNPEADQGSWAGVSGEVRTHHGLDRRRTRVFGLLGAEAAQGSDDGYRRLRVAGGVRRALGPLDGALEAGAGRTWGHAPPQKAFFLGGASTVRGLRPGSLVGEGHWFARAEVGGSRPPLRMSLFGDLGWAGPARELGSGSPARSVGLGRPFLDGWLRTDLARRLDEGGSWRTHIYLDGVL